MDEEKIIVNITNGFFGGMSGCAMVAQTLVNIGAVTILLIILVGGSVIEQIPIAALVGVMMMVAIGTFEWVSFRVNSLFDNLQKKLSILVVDIFM